MKLSEVVWKTKTSLPRLRSLNTLCLAAHIRIAQPRKERTGNQKAMPRNHIAVCMWFFSLPFHQLQALSTLFPTSFSSLLSLSRSRLNQELVVNNALREQAGSGRRGQTSICQTSTGNWTSSNNPIKAYSEARAILGAGEQAWHLASIASLWGFKQHQQHVGFLPPPAQKSHPASEAQLSQHQQTILPGGTFEVSNQDTHSETDKKQECSLEPNLHKQELRNLLEKYGEECVWISLPALPFLKPASITFPAPVRLENAQAQHGQETRPPSFAREESQADCIWRGLKHAETLHERQTGCQLPPPMRLLVTCLAGLHLLGQNLKNSAWLWSQISESNAKTILVDFA